MQTAIDLFAGAGGLSLGATQAGMTVEVAIERDTWACDTMRTNGAHGRVIESDICDLSSDWIRRELPRNVDLLMGGPPCQGFSRAGPTRKDPKDPRNALFRDFVRVARALEPANILIENVPGILRAKTASGAQVADIIVSELTALGYEVAIVALEAQDFGVPQLRPRVFFLASYERRPPSQIQRTHGGDDSLFRTQLPRVTLWDAISDLPRVDVGTYDELVLYVGPPSNDYQRSMRAGALDLLENHIPMRHSPRSVERFRHILPGQSQSDVPDEHMPRPRLRPADALPRTYDQNNRRMHPDRPCHTIPASFYANFLHPFLHRNFTPREGARLQSFPDHYVFRGKRTVVSKKLLAREGRVAEQHLCQYEQIGNAVPPLLAQAVVTALVSGHQELAAA